MRTRLIAVANALAVFGSLLLFCFDYSDNPQAWHNSMRLLAQEVMPRVAHLSPTGASAA